MGHQMENRHYGKNHPARIAGYVEAIEGSRALISDSQSILGEMIRSNERFRTDIQSSTEYLQDKKRSLDSIKEPYFGW